MAQDIKTIYSIIHSVELLRNDLVMLRDGDWIPDADSCQASIDVAEKISSDITDNNLILISSDSYNKLLSKAEAR